MMTRIQNGSASLTGGPYVVTIGNFDGVHLGHQELVAATVERAKALGVESCVYTFDPHPRRLLQPDCAPPQIQTIEHRCEILSELGIDVVVVENFTIPFSKRSAQWFAEEVIHQRLKAVELVVGYDYRFGAKREGNISMLTELLPNIAITKVSPVEVGGSPASSSRIRESVAEGRVKAAASIMGRHFSAKGRVVHGDSRGKGLGFPTANLSLSGLHPARGVYVVQVAVSDSSEADLWGVANLGVQPTFNGRQFRAEVHLLDYDEDLYGKELTVRFVDRIRGEKKFDSAQELVDRIGLDVLEARELIGSL